MFEHVFELLGFERLGSNGAGSNGSVRTMWFSGEMVAVVRRYDDPVEVRPAEGAAPDEDPAGRAPAAFLWQGRLYVVRAVLGSWHERRAWWQDAAARAVHGEVPASPVPVPVGGPLPQGPPPAGAGSGLGDEQTVWRVEAGAGRLRGLGVFDLVHDPAGGSAGCWRLLRVVD